MTFAGFITKILALGKPIIALLMALAVAYFLWGIVRYMFNYGDETARKESVQTMTYGIIALFVMISVWGLVGLLSGIIGQSVGIPQF